MSNQIVIAVGFKGGHPWTMLTKETDGCVLGWDIDPKRKGRGYVRRCSAAGMGMDSFPDDVESYWVARGQEIDSRGAKRLAKTPSCCRNILKRIPNAVDRWDDKGPDQIVGDDE